MAGDKDNQIYHLISRRSEGSQEGRGHICGPTGAADNHQRTAESLATDMGRASISLKTELLLFGGKQELVVCYKQERESRNNVSPGQVGAGEMQPGPRCTQAEL